MSAFFQKQAVDMQTAVIEVPNLIAGGGPTSRRNRYTRNDAAFVEYNTRLQSANLQTFTSAASKLAEWLGSDKAYYPNARVLIVSIIETAHANICRIQGTPSTPFTANKAILGLDCWYQPYFSLIKQVGSHLNHFEPELKGRLQLLVENAGIKIVKATLTDDSATQPKPFTPAELFERLMNRKFVSRELPTLIEEFLMCVDVGGAIHRLPKDDAQYFIDVIDEALDMPDLSPWARKQCLKPLYKMCGLYALLPKSMKISACYDRTSIALYRGGYADVWKGGYCGRDVAVKVMRVYSNSDLRKILGRFCKEVITWKTLQHPNILPLIGVMMSEGQFAMVSDWMVNGNINEFVKANPAANRLELLRDVARGLIYIHEQGMIHGDLKGANILIDQTCRARLADFGLLTVLSDPANNLSSSSYAQGGTARWMSPELIAPQDLGLNTSHPTKASDCYSLGMVIYETISGDLPFHEDTNLAVLLKVVRGERPCRTVGFTGSLWKQLEQCWVPHPDDRPSVEGVLQCLEMCDLSDADKQSTPTPTSIGVGQIRRTHKYIRKGGKDLNSQFSVLIQQ